MTSQISDTLSLFGRAVRAGEFIPLGNHVDLVEVTLAEARKSLDYVQSTACWRGYCAHWQLSDSRFELLRIEGGFRINGDGPIQARWLSGRLVLPMEDVWTFSEGWREAPYIERVRVTLDHGEVRQLEHLDWMQEVLRWEPSDESFKRRYVSCP